jgi:hypothetical protein
MDTNIESESLYVILLSPKSPLWIQHPQRNQKSPRALTFRDNITCSRCYQLTTAVWLIWSQMSFSSSTPVSIYLCVARSPLDRLDGTFHISHLATALSA